eukprot:TRINITY_DN105205_c0_g1_i1.p1 TRINITY_DN105205_c0_g1~~TRINITY_DN105205_c0_g1_i1.p1  ORF type:complete len:1220 (-),score=127.58 TRINITY_DN105205_c0_g1_i1:1178-4837(-)
MEANASSLSSEPKSSSPFTINSQLSESIETPAKLERKHTKTDILDSYAKLHPYYSLLYEKKANKDHYSAAYLISLSDGQKLTLKVAQLSKTMTPKINAVLREYYLQKTLPVICDKIVKAIDFKFIEVEDGAKIRFEMLLEYHEAFKDSFKGTMKYGRSIQMAYQLSYILSILEQQGVSHMNIKPDSIVLDENDDSLKLTNFATAISFLHSPEKIMEPLGQHCDRITGFTRFYMPPEVYQVSKPADLPLVLIPQKCDVFAFGMTCYEWIKWENGTSIGEVSRSTKFDHEAFVRTVKKNVKKYKMHILLDILDACLSFDPKKRSTFAEIRKRLEKELESSGFHEWIISEDKLTFQQLKEKADKHKNKGEHDAAIWEYEKAIKASADPKEIIQIYKNLGIAYLNAGKYVMCVKACLEGEKLIEKKDTHDFWELELILAETYICQLELDKADKVLSQDFPIKAWDYYKVNGSLYEAKGHYEAALKCYEKAKEGLMIGDKLELAKIENAVIKIMLKTNNLKAAKELYSNKDNCWERTVIRGKINDASNEYKEALACFNNAEEILRAQLGEDHPSVVEIYLCRAETQMKIGEYYKALNAVDKASCILKSIYPEDHFKHGEIETLYAKIYRESHNYNKAIECGKRAESLLGERVPPELSLILGESYVRLGRYEEAIGTASKVVKGFDKGVPFVINVLNVLGEAHILHGEVGKGFEHLGKAEEMCGDPETHFQLGTMYTLFAKGYMQLKEYKNALKCLKVSEKHLANKEDSLVTVYTLLGRLYNKLKKPELAIKYHQKAQRIYCKHKDKTEETRTLSYIGKSYYLLGEYDKSIACYKEALPSVEINMHLGDSYQGLEKFNEALECYNKYKANPLKLAIRMGEAYYGLKEYDKSINNFESVKIDQCGEKYKLRVYSGLGMAWKGKNELIKSIEYYKKAEEVIRNSSSGINFGLELAEVKANEGRLYFYLGKYSEAVTCLEEADLTWMKWDNLIEIYELLAKGFRKLGNIEKARKYDELLLKAEEKEVDDNIELASSLAVLGACENNIKEHKSAIIHLTKAAGMFKSLHVGEGKELRSIYEHLAHAYKKMGNFEKAKYYDNTLKDQYQTKQTNQVQQVLRQRIRLQFEFIRLHSIYFYQRNHVYVGARKCSKQIQIINLKWSQYQTKGLNNSTGNQKSLRVNFVTQTKNMPLTNLKLMQKMKQKKKRHPGPLSPKNSLQSLLNLHLALP